jgi:hypothetical protein
MSTTTSSFKAQPSGGEIDLYTRMQHLCANAQLTAGLFNAYRQDLTVHDRSYIADDAQAGDALLWVIKDSGTWLALVDESRVHAHAVLRTARKDEQIYLIEVDRHTGKLAYGRIRSLDRSHAWDIVDSLSVRPDRVPRRTYVSEHLKALKLDHTVVPTDLSRIASERGQCAYLKFEGNLLRVIVPTAGIDRILHRPEIASPAAFRLEVTSAFGHAELHVITAAAFKRRLAQMEKSGARRAA